MRPSLRAMLLALPLCASSQSFSGAEPLALRSQAAPSLEPLIALINFAIPTLAATPDPTLATTVTGAANVPTIDPRLKPKLEALVERAAALDAGAAKRAAPNSAARAAAPFGAVVSAGQVVGPLSEALSRYSADDIRRMSPEQLEQISAKIWDGLGIRPRAENEPARERSAAKSREMPPDWALQPYSERREEVRGVLSFVATTDAGARRAFAYFRSREEALAALPYRDAPAAVVAVDKNEILGRARIDVTYGGRAQTLFLSDAVDGPNFFGPDQGFKPIIAEKNKIVDRDEYDLLPAEIFRVDLSPWIPARILELVGSEGVDDANCFNAALYAENLHSRLEHTTTRDFMGKLAALTPAAGKLKPGDMGVLFHGAEPRNAFVIVATGAGETQWNFTKNGQGNKRPYQYQRHDEMLRLYPGTYVQYYRRTAAP